MDPERVDVPKARRLRYNGMIYDVVSAIVDAEGDIELLTILSRVKS